MSKALPPFIRKCPVCEVVLQYTNVKNRNQAEKKNKLCAHCRALEVAKRPDVIAKRRIVYDTRDISGDNNPFYGKHHTEETKEKLRQVDRSYTKTEEFRKNSARPGKKNGMYGKSVYDMWVARYGELVASEKWKEVQQAKSLKSTGKNNHMYGKDAPLRSGGGWGGWYKGWYFRSLRELSYMLNVIEKRGYEWETAEKLIIEYKDFNGVDRTYRADFIINKKVLVEIKPLKLMETPTNRLKKQAATRFCKERKLEYRMIDVRLIELSELISLYESKQVTFNKMYEERMQELCRLAKK